MITKEQLDEMWRAYEEYGSDGVSLSMPAIFDAVESAIDLQRSNELLREADEMNAQTIAELRAKLDEAAAMLVKVRDERYLNAADEYRVNAVLAKVAS